MKNPKSFRTDTSSSSITNMDFDIVARVIGNQNNLSIATQDTDHFRELVLSEFKNYIFLKNALKNLWNTYQYQLEYSSFLQGLYSEEEFCEIVEKFAEPFDKLIPPETIYQVSHHLSSILEQDLSSTDVSILLNVDAQLVENSFLNHAQPEN